MADTNSSKEQPVVIELSSSSSEDEDVEEVEEANRNKHENEYLHSNRISVELPGRATNNGATPRDDKNDNRNVAVEKERSVILFMEICGLKDRTQAMQQLRRVDYDMDQAVAAHFDQTKTYHHHNHGRAESDEEVEIIKETISTLPSSLKSRPLSLSAKPDAKIYEMSSGRSDQRSQDQHRPSQKWESIMEKCKELKVQFIDQEFPPTTTSLDGRKLQTQTHLSSSIAVTGNRDIQASRTNTASVPTKEDAIKCHCGIPATIRAVQKDGPNYGRFFLSCGKPRRRQPRPATNSTKKRKRQQNESIEQSDTTNNVAKSKDGGGESKEGGGDGSAASDAQVNNSVKPTLTTPLDKKKSIEQCQFFKWDDNHVQDNSKGRNAWTHKLSWFRFSSEHGYTLTGRIPAGKEKTHASAATIENYAKFLPDHVRQGAMGDCWFLSALAVVAEKPYLIQRILPHDHINNVGCYEVNFCLDGKWTNVIVDSLLPSIARLDKDGGKGSVSSSRKSVRDKRKGAFHTNNGIVIQPAFAAGTVMWPAIIEKVCSKNSVHICIASSIAVTKSTLHHISIPRHMQKSMDHIIA